MKTEDKEKIGEICWAATSFVEKYQDSILPSDEWLEKRIEEFQNGTMHSDVIWAGFWTGCNNAFGNEKTVSHIDFLKAHWLQEAALECVFTTLENDERSTLQELFRLGDEIVGDYLDYKNDDIPESKKPDITQKESELKKCIALIHDQGIYDKLNPLFQQLVDEYSDDSLFSRDFYGFSNIRFFPPKAGDPNHCKGVAGCHFYW